MPHSTHLSCQIHQEYKVSRQPGTLEDQKIWMLRFKLLEDVEPVKHFQCTLELNFSRLWSMSYGHYLLVQSKICLKMLRNLKNNTEKSQCHLKHNPEVAETFTDTLQSQHGPLTLI